MTAWFVWLGLVAQLAAGANDAATSAELPHLIGLCAHRLGKPTTEITLVAAFDGGHVVALDKVTTPLPKLLRRAARQAWFSVTPAGNEKTLPGATLLKHAHIDADGDAQHLRLGACSEAGTVYATRRITAARLPSPSIEALRLVQPPTLAGHVPCVAEAWRHGGGRLDAVIRDGGPPRASDALLVPCQGKSTSWVMLDPNSPSTQQAPKGEARIYAQATDAIACPVQVNHVNIGKRLLTWVLKQDDISVACAIIDDDRAPLIDEVWIEIEAHGC